MQNILKSTDSEVLEVIETLRRSQNELAKECGVVGNVISLFFHDLVIHFSGILIHRRARQSYGEEIYAPWVNQSYALAPFRYSTRCFDYGSITKFSALTLVDSMRVLPFSVGESIPYGYKQGRGAAGLIRLIGQREKPAVAYLPKREMQLNWLGATIDQVCREKGIPNADIVRENLQEHCRRHTVARMPRIGTKGLLIGTRCNLENRKHAVNFLLQEKQVIGLTHGEISNSIFNEPVFGYSDLTLCSSLIDYGSFDRPNAKAVVFFQPSRVIRRNSKVIAEKFVPSEKIEPPSRLSKALYIPTMHQGNFLWGPYHAYENAVYTEWQNSLVQSVPNLTVKVHPKTRIARSYDCAVEERRLEDCLSEFDFLIFDFFATGASLAMFSDKPVLYLDIGLRRFNPEFHKDLRQRCYESVIDLSLDQVEQIKRALEGFYQETELRRNTHLEKYAVGKRNDKIFSKAIKAALGY